MLIILGGGRRTLLSFWENVHRIVPFLVKLNVGQIIKCLHWPLTCTIFILGIRHTVMATWLSVLKKTFLSLPSNMIEMCTTPCSERPGPYVRQPGRRFHIRIKEQKGGIRRQDENCRLAPQYLTTGPRILQGQFFRRWKRDAQTQTLICQSLVYNLHMSQPKHKH